MGVIIGDPERRDGRSRHAHIAGHKTQSALVKRSSVEQNIGTGCGKVSARQVVEHTGVDPSVGTVFYILTNAIKEAYRLLLWKEYETEQTGLITVKEK